MKVLKKGKKDVVIPVSYTHLDVYKRQEYTVPAVQNTSD